MTIRLNQMLMRPVGPQNVTISALSQTITPSKTNNIAFGVVLTGTANNAYWQYGTTATTSDFILIPGVYKEFSCKPGEKISVIGMDGTLQYFEFDQ